MQLALLGPKYQTRAADGDQNFYWIGGLRGSLYDRGGFQEGVYGTPGLKLFSNLGVNGQGRAGKVINDFLYCVCGSSVFKVAPDGSFFLLGSVATSTGKVWIANNKNQIMFVDGLEGYIYTFADGSFNQIGDSNFLYPGSVCEIDGYFIGFEPNTGEFGISALDDGTTWGALDFAEAEGKPDNILAAISTQRELWLLGSDSTEIWYDSGANDFPFARLSGGFMENEGAIGAPNSLTLLDNTLYWINPQKAVVSAASYSPAIMSNDWLGYQINQMETWNDAIGYGYCEESRYFYVLTFPTANQTFAYDIKTGEWHKRASFGFGRHRANWCENFNGKNIIGDFENGKLYEMSNAYQDEDGQEIIRYWTLPEIADQDGNWIYHNRLVIKLETGLAATTEETAQMMIDYTENGGKIWSIERLESAGAVGEYKNLIRSNRLGKSRRRQYRLKVSSNRKWGILGVSAAVSESTS